MRNEANELTNQHLKATTRYGAVMGTLEKNGVRVWRGIPYAAAPVGAAQFRAPRPPATWDGVRESSGFGPICPQPPLAGRSPQEPMNDDCLSVNVWSPPGADGLPVMVWIHGGGYLYGSGSAPSSAGLNLAARGPAVIVTFNYRLGYRGFLDLSLLDGAEGDFETNLGLRDQIAALEWVRDDIQTFGGDPANVTIFGQSAGGASVCCLLASPLARGLFSGAIAQSPPANSVFDRERSAVVTARFLEIAGLRDATLADIRAADPDSLLDVSGRLLDEMTGVFPGHHAFQPVIDSDTLLDTPIRSIAAGTGSAVPLIIGSNEDEGSLFAGPPMPPLIPTSDESIRRFVDGDHPGQLDQIVGAYHDQGRFGAGVAIGGDGMVTMPATAIAEAMSTRAPVYVYRFQWSDERLTTLRLGTPHTLDVPFVFGTLDQFGLTDLESNPTARSVSDDVQHAWLSFARERRPGIGRYEWPRYSIASREVAVLGGAVNILRDPDAPRRWAWNDWSN